MAGWNTYFPTCGLENLFLVILSPYNFLFQIESLCLFLLSYSTTCKGTMSRLDVWLWVHKCVPIQPLFQMQFLFCLKMNVSLAALTIQTSSVHLSRVNSTFRWLFYKVFTFVIDIHHMWCTVTAAIVSAEWVPLLLKLLVHFVVNTYELLFK